jgi:hypothetical protein
MLRILVMAFHLWDVVIIPQVLFLDIRIDLVSCATDDFTCCDLVVDAAGDVKGGLQHGQSPCGRILD